MEDGFQEWLRQRDQSEMVMTDKVADCSLSSHASGFPNCYLMLPIFETLQVTTQDATMLTVYRIASVLCLQYAIPMLSAVMS
eukprot:5753374-Amphidinium_carterae.1